MTLRTGDIANWWHCELVTLRTGDIVLRWHCALPTLWTGDILIRWHCELVTLWIRDFSNNSPAVVWHTVWETMYLLLRFFIEEKIEWRIEVTGRWGRRIKHQVNDLIEKRGYCKLKQDALDCSSCRTGFGWGCGPVVRQTAEWMSVVRENGRRSGLVSNFTSWSLLWVMRSDVRSVLSTLWPTSTVRDNSIYTPDFRHHLFSLCRPTRNTLSVVTVRRARPHCSTVCTGAVLWKWVVMYLGTYSKGKTRRHYLTARNSERHIDVFFPSSLSSKMVKRFPHRISVGIPLLFQPLTPSTVAFWHGDVTCKNDSQFYRHLSFANLCSAASNIVPQTLLVVSFVFCSELDVPQTILVSFVFFSESYNYTDGSCHFVCVLQWVR